MPFRFINDFFHDENKHLYRKQITLDNQQHWISLHKSNISQTISNQYDAQVIMLEDLTETQRLEKELIHSERLASVGRLAAGVAHEIGNPVTGIACLAQNLQDDAGNKEDTLEAAKQIVGQTDRITNIVQTLVNFSHGESLEQRHKVLDISHCIKEAISLLKLGKMGKNIEVINEVPIETLVIGDELRLTQVFINLFSNARDASLPYGRIWAKASLTEQSVLISITDEGSGIPKKNQAHLFEPFFTTKEAGEGTGLGLALVYNIVEEHYGNIQVESPVFEDTQTGTRFTVTLTRFVENTH